MTLKLALILSAAWTLLIIVGAVVAISYLATHPIRGISAEERASAVGGGMGMSPRLAMARSGCRWPPSSAGSGGRRDWRSGRRRNGRADDGRGTYASQFSTFNDSKPAKSATFAVTSVSP
jgi:hypothetical protein